MPFEIGCCFDTQFWSPILWSTSQPIMYCFLSSVAVFPENVACYYVYLKVTSVKNFSTQDANSLLFTGKHGEGEKEMGKVNSKPNVDICLTDLMLVLGPELRIVYPLILNFAVSGELELDGMAHPKWIRPKGVLTFENGDVNLVATQASPFYS